MAEFKINGLKSAAMSGASRPANATRKQEEMNKTLHKDRLEG
ncbi:MAG: hypothetical protein ABJM82_16925 [Shimia thalassica]